MELNLNNIIGFQWDSGNDTKSFAKHAVTCEEAQEIFMNSPLISKDEGHSDKENRWRALGETDGKRLLHATFTIRGNLIRIISARPMHRKERLIYEKHH